MSTEDILTGIAIIVGLAVICQLVAPKCRVPALVLLLPAGFIAGIVFDSVDPLAIFGSAFTPMVNVVVGIILFHGGLELIEDKVERPDRKIVRRLVWIGAVITWACATLSVLWLFDLSAEMCLLVGAIVIVSGPTVVGPLLRFVRPDPRIRRILAWEGTLIDPVGALTAVIVFQAVQATDSATVGEALQKFGFSILVGFAMGVVGIGLIWVGMKLAGPSRLFGTQVLLGSIIVVTAFSDAITDDAGLVAAVIMGMLATRIDREQIRDVKPFFDVVVSFSIGVLFVSIASLVTPQSLDGLVWPSLGIVAILVLIVRPLSAYVNTAFTSLTGRQRLFIGWMAPRGIVAAATASSFSTTLIAKNIPGGADLLPIVFMVIAGTVAFYSATAVPMAKMLKLREPEDSPPVTGLPAEEDALT